MLAQTASKSYPNPTPIKLRAGRDGIVQKDSTVIRRVLKDCGIKYRCNIRSRNLEFNQDQASVRFTDSSGWVAESDQFDVLFRDYMRSRCTYKGAGENSREVALTFTNSEYYTHISALCDPANRVDPFLQWLEGLPKWDVKERIATVFTELFGCEQDSKSEFFARYIFGASIQRTLKPGTKIKICPILCAHYEGIGKTTFLSHIFPEELRDECFCGFIEIRCTRKEDYMYNVAPSTLVEVPDLYLLKDKWIARIKTFISETSDYFRPVYHRPYTEKRRWIPIVTTTSKTHDVVPNDPQGERYWPVLVLPGNVMRVADQRVWIDQNRDQLWAEALAYARSDRPVHWTPDLEDECATSLLSFLTK